MADWILPLDTVESAWLYAYADLMHLRWHISVGQRPPGGSGPGSTTEIVQALGGMERVLDEPDLLRLFLYHRFAADGVHGVLNPFASPDFSVWRVSELSSTYAVTNHGLLLPAFGPERPDATHAHPSDVVSEVDLYQRLRELGAPTPEWVVTGKQMDLLRAAASQAIVALWRHPDYGRSGQYSFHTDVLAVYNVLDKNENPLPLEKGWLSVEPITSQSGQLPRSSSPPAEDIPYFNPQDGAGYFTPGGYTLFGPPPPPVYDAYVSPDLDTWSGSDFMLCGLYAPRYAVDCTTCCPDRAEPFYRATVRRDGPPSTSSEPAR